MPSNSPVRPTTWIEAPHLAGALGLKSLVFASETFQWTGSFKFRAAYEVAAHVPNSLLIAASSGNFGQALAYSASLLGKRAIIVMPQTSAEVKIRMVGAYGGTVDLIDIGRIGRTERVTQLAEQHPEAYIASAFDDLLVIRGNASLGREIAAAYPRTDVVVAPVGGGGLTSGVIQGLCEAGAAVEVIGAEPAIGNDAARSLRAGRIVANQTEPQTIADGARTVQIGEHNWKILRAALKAIVETPEKQIIEAVRTLFLQVNLKAEPTGALALAAILTEPQRFAGQSVCCVVSGGNVDPGIYARLIAQEN